MIFPFFFHFLRRRPATCSSFHMGVLPISSDDWGEEKLLCKESIFFTNVKLFLRDHLDLYDCVSVYCRVCEHDMVKMCRCCGVCLNAATQHVYKVNLLFYHHNWWNGFEWKLSCHLLSTSSSGQTNLSSTTWSSTSFFVTLQKSGAQRKQVDWSTRFSSQLWVTAAISVQSTTMQAEDRRISLKWVQGRELPYPPVSRTSYRNTNQYILHKMSTNLFTLLELLNKRVFGMFENTSTRMSCQKTGSSNFPVLN